jgi:hypothetical protein
MGAVGLAAYEIDRDTYVGKQLIKDFDGHPYLGQVRAGKHTTHTPRKHVPSSVRMYAT